MSYVYFEQEFHSSFTAEELVETLNALAKEWGVPLSKLSIDAEYAYSYGDSVSSHLCVSANRERTPEEELKHESETKKQQEAIRLNKLSQLERLQKELGIK